MPRKPNKAAQRRAAMSAASSRQGRAVLQTGKTAQSLTVAEAKGSLIGEQPGSLIITADKEDGGQTILQRLSPSSRDKVDDFNVRAAKGWGILEKLMAKRKAYNHHDGLVWHCGIWAQHGVCTLTPETAKHPAVVGQLLHWVRSLCDRHLYTRAEEIAPDFLAALEERRGGLGDVRDMMGSKLTEGCHHWWLMAAFFHGETKEEHKDRRDERPSFLFNFGATIALELPDQGLQVKVRKGDLIIFDSQHQEHRTRSLEHGDRQRWGVGLFIRQVVPDRKLVDDEIWRKGKGAKRVERAGKWASHEREAKQIQPARCGQL